MTDFLRKLERNTESISRCRLPGAQPSSLEPTCTATSVACITECANMRKATCSSEFRDRFRFWMLSTSCITRLGEMSMSAKEMQMILMPLT